MRLLNSSSRELELLHDPPAEYAIVSHRWGDESEEVLFTDIGDIVRTQSKGRGYHKILGSCSLAARDGLDYVWLDTCCIDRSNSTELQTAINAMYNWYHKSTVCYVYLHDISDPAEFTKSEWFMRGWTLQELIAPKFLRFYTKDWHFIGGREHLTERISERTGISPDILLSDRILREISISQKMVWAAERETTKIEDRAYSMLGILGIRMVPLYGIDDDAFEELQHRLIVKSPDQTLFAWFHTFKPPLEDVEMVDAEAASHPALTSDSTPDATPGVAPNSAPNPNPDVTSNPIPNAASNNHEEPQEPDPPLNRTGLLASSPSHYLKCYEIREHDFREHYVNSITHYGYRSQFSISNNLVRITLPMKHVAGRVWKAVLRCSFDPPGLPGGNQTQRPLVIYLKEIQSPWKFARVHLAPQEEMVDDQTPTKMRGVSGSLEPLKDSELKLQGFTLRDIDVVGRDESSSDDRQKQPLSDPNSLPEPTEAERIAHLPRHPPGVKTINIMVCGEPGVATGRVINFIVGSTVLKPLTDYDREPMAVTVIDSTIRSKQVRILYVIGPRDPYLELPTYHTTLRNMYRFIQAVRDAGGIHLMLMCIVGSRVTSSVENNFRLFHNYVCHQQVPMILVVTGLGKARRMEDWWERHRNDPELLPMTQCVLDHACITVLQGDDEEQEQRHQQSKEIVQRLIREFMERLETPPKVYLPKDARQWFIFMGTRAMDFLLFGKQSLEREAVKKTLREGVHLPELEAIDLVRQFFDCTIET